MRTRRLGYILKVFPKISETFIVNELVELRRQSIDVTIFSMTQPSESLQHAVVRQSGLLDCVTYSMDDFVRRMQADRPDCIHAHFATEATQLAHEIASDWDIPYTFTAHGYDVFRRPPANFAELAAASRGVVTVSEANADHIVDTFGVPRGKLHVIPCGIDTQQFRPGLPPAGRPEIVCVARLVPVKNLSLLIRACSILRDFGMDFHCSILGEGRSRDELTQLIAELELADHLSLEGAQDQQEVCRWWQRASVGVLSSQSEGMPVALMEAAASAVPVVATSVGGVPELVEDHVTGLLVPPDDAVAMAEAIAHLLSHPQAARAMGESARQRAVDRFSVQHQVNRLLDVWSRAGSSTTGVVRC